MTQLNPAGNQSRSGKAGPAAGKRVLWGDGRPSLRSVDSEIKRCVIEPRKFLVVSPSSWSVTGAGPGIATPGRNGVPGHTGAGEHGE